MHVACILICCIIKSHYTSNAGQTVCDRDHRGSYSIAHARLLYIITAVPTTALVYNMMCGGGPHRI